MIKTLSASLILLMLVTISTTAIVGAQTEEPMMFETTTTTVDETAPEEMTPEQKVQKRKDRIASAKEKAVARISANQERKIAGACKAAQSKIQNTQTNSALHLENRQAKYTSISDKLKTLSEKLAEAGADVVLLNSAITEMDTKFAENFAELEEYTAGLEDMAMMDCETDPSGFKAVLEESRTNRKEILSQTTLIRAYINENIKPLLQDIRTSLEATSETEGAEEGTSNE